MKRQKKLTILLAVFVVCVVAVVVISRMNFEETMKGTKTTIIDVDSSEITYLSWKYEGEEVAFQYEEDKWSYVDDEKMPVNQDLLNDIAKDLSKITSDKMVEDVKKLSLYGLNNPAYTLTIKADKTYEISIGDEAFSDGEVYVSTGDEYVYLTDSELIDKISYSLYDLVQEEKIPEMKDISSVSIEKKSPVELVYKEESGYCYSDAYTYYLKDGDNYKNLDNETTSGTIDTLSGLEWEECVDYYAEDSELKKYGLDSPEATVSISYKNDKEEEKEFSYEVAKSNDKYYARLKDSRMVYSISSSVYEAANNASYKELAPEEVILLDWDTVDSIDIELDGNFYTIDLKQKGDDEYSYKFNGSEIEFGNVLEELLGITVVKDEKEELGDNKEELSLIFHRNTDEYSEVELTFYQYDGTYCIPVLDGNVLNCVNREDVVSLKEAIHSIILDSTSK